MSLSLPVGSYSLPSPSAACQNLVNCFAEVSRSGKQPLLLRRSPGIAAFAEVTGSVSVRGLLFYQDVLYAVIGSGFYSVSDTGVETQLNGSGPAITGNGRVYMEGNNAGDIVIVTPENGLGYKYDGSTFDNIDDITFIGWGASGLGFIDSYFVFSRPDSPQFFNSGLNAVTFNGLDIASAEGAPGNLLNFIIDHREIILAKSQNMEIWYDAANSPGSPFSRSPNGFLEIGCGAAASLCKQDNSVHWLANDLTTRKLDGGTPTRTSQHGIESILQRLSRTTDCFAMTYTQEGHLFVVFTFPFAGRTFVLDVTTKEWHERDSLGHSYWRPSCIVQAYEKQIVGDSFSGKLGILDPDTHEEWGEPQRVAWTYQPMYATGNKIIFRRFELGYNPGDATIDGQGSNPLATLKISKDNGNTFTVRPTRSLGVRGDYTARAVWWNNGSGRGIVCRMEVTDPLPLFVTDTQVIADGARL